MIYINLSYDNVQLIRYYANNSNNLHTILHLFSSCYLAIQIFGNHVEEGSLPLFLVICNPIRTLELNSMVLVALPSV